VDIVMTVGDVVGELRDGMTIGIGGWGSRRKPMALVRAIGRAGLRDLTVVTYGGPDVGLLIAYGCVRRVVTGFVSLDSIALEPHFRQARGRGTVELTELDEGMFYWGLLAAANRLPFLPIRAGLGSDVLRVNPELRTVRSPYPDGEELAAGPPQGLLVNRAMVDGVVATPHGAHFTSCVPDYGRDEAFQREYAAAAADPVEWDRFRATYLDGDEADYQKAVGSR
jgi:glutaconate CoA-transferase subunit A